MKRFILSIEKYLLRGNCARHSSRRLDSSVNKTDEYLCSSEAYVLVVDDNKEFCKVESDQCVEKNYKVEYVRGMGSAGWGRGVAISNSFPCQPH